MIKASLHRASQWTGAHPKEVIELSSLEDLLELMRAHKEDVILSLNVYNKKLKGKGVELDITIYDDYVE